MAHINGSTSIRDLTVSARNGLPAHARSGLMIALLAHTIAHMCAERPPPKRQRTVGISTSSHI